MADAIELRGVLEGTAARFAAERLGSQLELEPLVRLAEQLDAVVQDLSPESFVRYVELNDAYHEALVALAKSPTLSRSIANVYVLPFASPGALLSSQALLPRSREILVVAQHHHRALIDAIGDGHGTRAAGARPRACPARAAESPARARGRIGARPAARRVAAPGRRPWSDRP